MPCEPEASSETVCRDLCERLQIAPVATTLFGLRVNGTAHYLPACKILSAGVKYDFRVRFQAPSLSKLKQIDEKAFIYYYHQVRWDLVNNMIAELVYPNFKEKVVGLAVTNMYIDLLDKEKEGVCYELLQRFSRLFSNVPFKCTATLYYS